MPIHNDDTLFRERIARGIHALVEAMRSTLGPQGRAVPIKLPSGASTMTTDGMTVALGLERVDRLESAGVELLRNSAAHVQLAVGDGATTASLLTQAIVFEGMRLLAAGANPLEVKHGIEMATQTILDELSRNATTGPSQNEIANVAMTSAGDDEALGHLVTRIIEHSQEESGPFAIVIDDYGGWRHDELRVVPGMQLNYGYLSARFLDNYKQRTVALERPLVLLYDGPISALTDLDLLIDQVIRSRHSLLIAATELSHRALNDLADLHHAGTLRNCAITVPTDPFWRRTWMQDFAVATGGDLMMADGDLPLNAITFDLLGNARWVEVSEHSTIVIDSGGSQEEIDRRVNYIDFARTSASLGVGGAISSARLAMLTSKVAMLRIGGSSAADAALRITRFQNILRAARAASAQGVVPGGGTALVRARQAIASPRANWQQRAAFDVVLNALGAPLSQLAENAGADPTEVLRRVSRGSGSFGYNVRTRQYGDLAAMGVLDAAEVPRMALQAASSVACTLLVSDNDGSWPARISKRERWPEFGRRLFQVLMPVAAPVTSHGAGPAVLPSMLPSVFLNNLAIGGGIAFDAAGMAAGASSVEVREQAGAVGTSSSDGQGDGGDPVPDGDSIADSPHDDKQINVWTEGKTASPFTLHFMVGEPHLDSLTAGENAAVPLADIPAQGLVTEWIVSSANVLLTALTPGTSVQRVNVDGSEQSEARFQLIIPKYGNSSTVKLMANLIGADDKSIDIVVYANNSPYKQLHVVLNIDNGSKDTTPATPAPSAQIRGETTYRLATELFRQPSPPWLTAPGSLDITVLSNAKCYVKGCVRSNGKLWEPDMHCPWPAQAQVASLAKRVSEAAEEFRKNHSDYLDSLPMDDFERRLKALHVSNGTLEEDWSKIRDTSSEAHRQAWAKVATDDKLFELAYDGHALYQLFFQRNTELRINMDTLEVGASLNFNWPDLDGGTWAAHVPWGLMYQEQPTAGAPIDPLKFIGLRYRIGYVAYQMETATGALGRPADVQAARCLYWGDGDTACTESNWQRKRWSQWPKQLFVPNLASGETGKLGLARVLSSDPANPMAVLYFYCRSAVGARANELTLLFSNTPGSENELRQTEIGQYPLAGRPLVFANACSTAAADPYVANLLEMAFIKQRNCRAFLGTEANVPIVLASRFAAAFFHFFFRQVDGAPVSAGEAVAQARMFLWSHYRNLGGLLYCLINKHDLYMADETEVWSLR